MNFKNIVAFSALALAISQAYGMTLGDARVVSSLGEPLHAIIPVQGKMATLAASVAPGDKYETIGLQYVPAIAGVTVTVERKNGKWSIVLRSASGFNGPFADVLLDVNWTSPNGVKESLERDYTILLSPPGYQVGAALNPSTDQTPIQPPAQDGIRKAAPVFTAASDIRESEPDVRLNSRILHHDLRTKGGVVRAKTLRTHHPLRTRTHARATAKLSTIVVKSGQTLLSIARIIAPTHTNDAAKAIFMANPDAFIRNNPNLVRAGHRLVIPGAVTRRVVHGDVRSVTQADQVARTVASNSRSVLQLDPLVDDLPLRTPAPAPAAEASAPVAPSGNIKQVQAQLNYYRLELAIQKTQLQIFKLQQEQAAAQSKLHALGLGSASKLTVAAIKPGASKPKAAPQRVAPTESTREQTTGQTQRPVQPKKAQLGSSSSKFILRAAEVAGSLLFVSLLIVGFDGSRMAGRKSNPLNAPRENRESDNGDLDSESASQIKGIFPPAAAATIDEPVAPKPVTRPKERVAPEADLHVLHEAGPLAEAEFHFHDGAPLKAIEILRACIDAEPNNERAWVKLIELLSLQGCDDELEKVLAHCPRHIRAAHLPSRRASEMELTFEQGPVHA